MKWGPLVILVIQVLLVMRIEAHGRMVEPPSRASAWRMGFPTPRNQNDNQVYCGGFGVQHDLNGGKCGICGDPWDQFPRDHEAPGGIYATGIITKTYRQGSIIPVVLDITANHQGYFEFKLCPNNDIWQDPRQACFDRHILKTGKSGSNKHYIFDYITGVRVVYVWLPMNMVCEQCILQWTYTAGNNWGTCNNGTSGLGCGPQETFRACSDIRIVPRDLSSTSDQTSGHTSSSSSDTELEAEELDLYYDDLVDNNLYAEEEEDDWEYDSLELESLQESKLKLLKRKLALAAAIKKLKKLLTLSKLMKMQTEERLQREDLDESARDRYERDQVSEPDTQHLRLDGLSFGGWDASSGATVRPWWSRTNSHGRRRR